MCTVRLVESLLRLGRNSSSQLVTLDFVGLNSSAAAGSQDGEKCPDWPHLVQNRTLSACCLPVAYVRESIWSSRFWLGFRSVGVGIQSIRRQILFSQIGGSVRRGRPHLYQDELLLKVRLSTGPFPACIVLISVTFTCRHFVLALIYLWGTTRPAAFREHLPMYPPPRSPSSILIPWRFSPENPF